MSSLQTPRQRTGIQRPSYAGDSSPTLPPLSASTAGNRKASLQALTGAQTPDTVRTPLGASRMAADTTLEVGEAVNVPGEMFGVVKFVGSVRGKSGVFVGVELDERFAARGKNSGDVDGVNYFNTVVPGAGIFLPIHRATRKYSDSFNASPNTPTYSTVNGIRTTATPPTPATAPHKFSQTVGPGVRPSSPNFKPKRPSLPRPESPFRKNPPNLAPTPSHNLSSSVRGPSRPGITPSKNSTFKSSTSRAPSSTTTPGRPYSRTGSRLGNRGTDSILNEDNELTPVGSAITSNSRATSQGSIPSFSQPLRSTSRLGSTGGSQDAEVQRLRSQLAERDKRLEDQASSLAEMESSVKELSALIPADGNGGVSSPGDYESDTGGQSVAQLRQMLREKNEKITLLTAEFDAHRADFRSTLDSLEMASTETERVYEEQKTDLLAQLEALHEIKEQRDDFEGVAQQLKGLEDLVAELEEGLEESRRGEAEARGEVEFLRGEVERGRSELRREREKGEKTRRQGDGVAQKEVEVRDDEIRGLKAIIHSLSEGKLPDGAAAAALGGNSALNDEQTNELRAALEDSRREKEALESEIEQLRRDVASASMPPPAPPLTNGHHARNESDRTATASSEKGLSTIRTRSDTVKAPRGVAVAAGESKALPSHPSSTADGATAKTTSADTEPLFCEICASASHDTLDCAQLSSRQQGPASSHNGSGGYKSGLTWGSGEGEGKENAFSGPSLTGRGEGKAMEVKEQEKWCALCERDGHLAFDCPEEQY